jgi:hypothetical protein
VAPESPAAGARCATAVSPRRAVLPVSVSQLRAARPNAGIRPQGVPASLQIELIVGDDLAANPEALAAFRRAADLWEAQFSDPIVVRIEADLLDLGNDDVIGQAGSVGVSGDYAMVAEAVVSDGEVDGDPIVLKSIGATLGGEYALSQPFQP